MILRCGVLQMILRCTCLFFTLLTPSTALPDTINIIVVTSDDENREFAGRSFAGITVETYRPVLRAVELAIHESSTLFDTLDVSVSLRHLKLDSEKRLEDQLQGTESSAILILDLPLEKTVELAGFSDELGIVAVNVRHSDVDLRESLCLQNLFHTIPSDLMYFDALAQFLVYRSWRKVLLVRGPSARDEARATQLARSLKKFGATLEEERVFTLSHHPDDRDDNKPEFLTGGVSYDVVAVIDSDRDYGRYIQYSTRSARPVVGDVGLSPRSWHFALERYGAPQLNERYRTFKPDDMLGPQEAMTDAEFAAWSAVKIITNSINTRDAAAELNIKSIYQDEASQVDLYKGTRGSIRQWNNQLRQPILLTANDAVIAIAPMPKFLHPKHYVDTLGLDQPESTCQLR